MEGVHFPSSEGPFKITVLASLVLHILLLGFIINKVANRVWEIPPVKARIGIRIEMPKPARVPETKPRAEVKVQKKAQPGKQKKPEPAPPELSKPVQPKPEKPKPIQPKPAKPKPVLSKPVLTGKPLTRPSSLTSQIAKPEPKTLKKPAIEAPRVEVTLPQQITTPQALLPVEQEAPLLPEKKELKPISTRFPAPEKPAPPSVLPLKRDGSIMPERSLEIVTDLPQVKKSPVPPSPIKSRKSKKTASQLPSDLPSSGITLPPTTTIQVPEVRVPKAVRIQPQVSKPVIKKTIPKLPSVHKSSISSMKPKQPLPLRRPGTLPPFSTPKPVAPVEILPKIETPLTIPAQKFNLDSPLTVRPSPLKADIDPALSKDLSKLPSLPQTTAEAPLLRPEPLGVSDREMKLPVPEPEPQLDKPLIDLQPEKVTADSQKDVEDDSFIKLEQIQLLKQAIEEYNQHIKSKVRAKLGGFKGDLYVRIMLEIGISGQIISHQIIESSPNQAYNRAAELAIRNTQLNPLPEALAQNPPYIVTVRIIP